MLKLFLVNQDFAERYGTTPLEFDEWITMLRRAGFQDIVTEFDDWSKPEMFWQVRQDRKVTNHSQIFTWTERINIARKIFLSYGLRGMMKAFKNEQIVIQAIRNGKLGYCLFKGIKNADIN